MHMFPRGFQMKISKEYDSMEVQNIFSKKKEMQNNQPEAIWRAFFSHNSEGILLIYKFSKLDIHCTSDGIRSLCFNCSDPRATHAQAQPF